MKHPLEQLVDAIASGMSKLAITLALALAASAETKPAEPKPMTAEQKLEVSRANSKVLAAQRNLAMAAQQYQTAQETLKAADAALQAALDKQRAATGAPARCIADDDQNWATPAQKPDGTPYLIPCTIETKEAPKK
jgi:hypothetical protein